MTEIGCGWAAKTWAGQRRERAMMPTTARHPTSPRGSRTNRRRVLAGAILPSTAVDCAATPPIRSHQQHSPTGTGHWLAPSWRHPLQPRRRTAQWPRLSNLVSIRIDNLDDLPNEVKIPRRRQPSAPNRHVKGNVRGHVERGSEREWEGAHLLGKEAGCPWRRRRR
ncbi:hypothetical protein BJ912DRAFT_971785 [Pholiota molesta]|nr:hypothetical protein BJ912DRAFT_971785 [Pholiota molesta]